MNLSLYAAASGMDGQQLNLNVIANNLANVNTTGFKKSKVEFQDLFYQNQRNVGAEAGNGEIIPAGVQVGNGTQVISTAKVFTQGQLTQTGQKMDIAIQGDGFFEVEMPDGTTGYTRDGSFKLGPDGRWFTSNGMPLMGGFEPIPAGSELVGISPAGDVTVRNGDAFQVFRVQIARFNNPSGLQSLGSNLYAETPASGAAEVGNPGLNNFGSLKEGFLEGSNVNVVEEMVNMILAQRAYEINSKSIQTSDEMMQRISQLKR